MKQRGFAEVFLTIMIFAAMSYTMVATPPEGLEAWSDYQGNAYETARNE